MSDHTPIRQDEDSFSSGPAQLRRAASAASAPSPAADPRSASRAARPRLKIEKPPVAGFDPYNSTGGFDRNNAWNRIPKR